MRTRGSKFRLVTARQLVNVGSLASTGASAPVASECDSPVNDLVDLDTSKRADSGCSAATGGRGEAGHPAEDPRCPPGHHLHGAIGAAHRGPTAGGRHRCQLCSRRAEIQGARRLLPARPQCSDTPAIPRAENCGRWRSSHQSARSGANPSGPLDPEAVIRHSVALKIGDMPAIHRVFLKPRQEPTTSRSSR